MFTRQWLVVLAAVLVASNLCAGTPTLQEVWSRHDQIVMHGPGRPVKPDPDQARHRLPDEHQTRIPMIRN